MSGMAAGPSGRAICHRDGTERQSREVVMVDIQFGSQGSPQLQVQSPQPVNTSAAVAGNDVKTIQQNASNVVTLSAESGNARNERRRDTLGRQPDETVSTTQTLEDLRATSRRTQFDFTEELTRIFLAVIDTRPAKGVNTIPPERTKERI